MSKKQEEATPLIENNIREGSGKKSFLSKITVEPALALTAFGYGLALIFTTNLWIDKICYQQFGYSHEVCTQLDSGQYTLQQDNVQRVVNQYNVYKQLIEYIPALFAVLLLGAWSDRRGRRLPVILPVVGQFLLGLGLTANSFWWSLSPPFLLLAFIPVGLSGALTGMFMGAFAYVSVSSGQKSRTSRVSIVGVIMLLCLPLGQGVATYLYDVGGYVMVFGVQSGLSAISVVYLLLRLETRPDGSAAPETEGSVCEVLSPAYLKQTLMVVFRSREGKTRSHIIGNIMISCLVLFTYGLVSYDFLFTRKRFSWDINTFTIWSMTDHPSSAIGLLVVMPLLSYRFGVQDSMLGFVGGVSMVFNYVIKATAPVSWVLYVASIAGLLRAMPGLSARSAASKLVNNNELGAVFAVLAAGETIIPVVSSSIYTCIYNATLETFPGAIYAFTAGVSLVICCLNVWLMTDDDRRGLYRQIP
ncbi:solute carrier family 46 member 3-like isoform X2 [Penaeus japonicus]|uniref:solute carrier family 46 member 3-like isoform X1 n=1 Tax=Penaeus japonicus TaxID=27405 RepID=UPI001C715F19|nr:solute carrier family 46 member 3-like isoform X1 [Penaeus japonicus]XP_042860373.1 solute carrier family 46 member 3-like isoform X2 [Penaeus japonicus]